MHSLLPVCRYVYTHMYVCLYTLPLQMGKLRLTNSKVMKLKIVTQVAFSGPCSEASGLLVMWKISLSQWSKRKREKNKFQKLIIIKRAEN